MAAVLLYIYMAVLVSDVSVDDLFDTECMNRFLSTSNSVY